MTAPRVLPSGDGQDEDVLDPGVLVPKLVVPLVLLALLLLGGAAVVLVVLRRRRPPAQAGTAASTAAETALPPAARTGERARVEQPGVRTLAPGERQRWVTVWEGVQRRAQDRPVLALSEADAVVERLLRECGFPVDDPRPPGDVVPGRAAEVLGSFRAGRALEQANSSTRSDPAQVQRALEHFDRAFAAVVADGAPTPVDAPRLLSADRATAPRSQRGR